MIDKGRAEIIIEQLKKKIEEASNAPLSSGKVVIDKSEILDMLNDLEDITINEMKTYREINDKRARLLREAKQEADEIIFEAEQSASRIRVTKRRPDEKAGFRQSELSREDKLALRTANDIYAASLIYTDETLTEVDHLVNNAYETIEKEYERVISVLKDKMRGISENKTELVNSLNELSKTDRYSQVLEISQLLSNELYNEKEKAKKKAKENALQLEIKFDTDEKPSEDKEEGVADSKNEKERPKINPDRTEVKINIKKDKGPEIKIMPREAKNKTQAEVKPITALDKDKIEVLNKAVPSKKLQEKKTSENKTLEKRTPEKRTPENKTPEKSSKDVFTVKAEKK